MVMRTINIFLLFSFFLGTALAEEGMWTFNNVPTTLIQKKFGFTVTSKWLDHLQKSSIRLAGGCSGSFVSPRGLILTNHHCAVGCIGALSNRRRNLVATGFYAKRDSDEVRCPNVEVNRLIEISDVTPRIEKATRGLRGDNFGRARKEELSKIEKECARTDRDRCDVVTLYEGGQYHLYKYRRFQDVRLVFAPESAVAYFGGDLDNFNFPRYNFDLSFLRVYEKGKPARIDQHFSWSSHGTQKGDLTFVTGHPGHTSRLKTISQLTFERDVRLLDTLFYLAELRGILKEFRKKGPEAKRISATHLLFVENAFKAYKGRLAALADDPFFQGLKKAETNLRNRIVADPQLKRSVGRSFEEIDLAVAALRNFYTRLLYLEGYPLGSQRGFASKLFRMARTIVRAAEERKKPNHKRLRRFVESNLPAVGANLLSPSPIHKDLEETTLTFSLQKLQEAFGSDDPMVRKVLGKQSPAQLAEKLIEKTKLDRPSFRKRLYEGGSRAVQNSNDPMIGFARSIDKESRALRRRYEAEVESIITRASHKIARARFSLEGLDQYPDATFTLRLSYGQVKGFREKGQKVEPYTSMGGAFDRHTGVEPFALPSSWLKAKGQLDLKTPLNLCTTNDIIGGNSGSPILNQRAEVVGLVFDGNIHSLGGEYGFDESLNRAIAVDGRAILEALSKIYEATRLVKEIEVR